jgi:hypothetical protein
MDKDLLTMTSGGVAVSGEYFSDLRGRPSINLGGVRAAVTFQMIHVIPLKSLFFVSLPEGLKFGQGVDAEICFFLVL